MANFYTNITAEKPLTASSTQHDELKALLAKEPEDGVSYHGFSIEYDPKDGDIYLFAEDNGCADELPDEFLAALGRLIAANKLSHLEFGEAWTCDKMRPGSHGGTKFRITADGCLIYPNLRWPRTRGGKVGKAA